MANFLAPDCPQLPWMFDFHSKDGKVLNGQWSAAYADTCLEHLVNLTPDSDPLRFRSTKIMCTIGPSCFDMTMLVEMMKAGMNLVRIKMALTKPDECRQYIKTIRKARDTYSKMLGYMYPIAICLDIGPAIRTGHLEDSAEEVEFHEGIHTIVTNDPMYEPFVSEEIVYINCDKLLELLQPGDKIYLENGTIILETLQVDGREIKCVITRGGKLSNLSTVDMPGVPIMLESLSETDIENINLAVQENVDILILSDVKTMETLTQTRKILDDANGNGKGILIIPKIEFPENLEHFEDLLKQSDGIIVARERIRIQVSSEKVCLVQKALLAKCLKAGKPAIIAGSLAESMISYSSPLKAEICDIANAVLDGSDCVSLSRETSIGDDPCGAIRMVSSICRETEPCVYQRGLFHDLTRDYKIPEEPERAIVIAVIEASMRCNAAAIIVCTVSGKSARLLSRYRPRCPIIAVTRHGHVARKLCLYKGVLPFHYIRKPRDCWKKDVNIRLQVGVTYGKLNGLIRAGDAIVVVKGLREGSGFTNCLKIVYASEFDALPPEKP